MSSSVAGQPADLAGGKARGIKAFLANADLCLALVTEIPAEEKTGSPPGGMGGMGGIGGMGGMGGMGY